MFGTIVHLLFDAFLFYVIFKVGQTCWDLQNRLAKREAQSMTNLNKAKELAEQEFKMRGVRG